MDHNQVQLPAGFDLKQFFADIKAIAVVGYSDNPERAGHYVAHYLAHEGYRVLAINPRFDIVINGLACYPNLAGIPAHEPIDVIDAFRSPKYMPDVARAAAAMQTRPKYLVMQPGAESEEAAEICRDSGIIPLPLCMMAAHKIWGA